MCQTVLISSLCPWQILPPTEKPTPIRSPTLQVLDYGEAVALYNFTGDLPVELSFRKVSDAIELRKRLEKIEEKIVFCTGPLSELFQIMCTFSMW